jgi:hypothetical protein
LPFVQNLPGSYNKKALIGQGEFLDKPAYSHQLDCGSWLRKMLPPTQMKVIPGCQGKTPVAQMHFASELPLPRSGHSINGQKITIQANSGRTQIITKLIIRC